MTTDVQPISAVDDALLRPHLVVHPSGEIHIKSSRTRRRFVRMLGEHIKDVLARVAPDCRLIARDQRFRVVGDDLEPASESLARIFGVHRVTRVFPIPITDLDALAEAVGAKMIDAVRDRTFAVRVKRRGTHSWSSKDASLAIARPLFEAARGVDLTHPEVTVRIEVYQDVANLVTGRWNGPSGLPTGGQERALTLISGGFDSPVAAWMLMRRGSPVDFVHFTLECSQSEHALSVAHALRERWGSGESPIYWRIDFQPAREALLTHVDSRFRQVVLKQLMIACADALAERLGVHALITGEAVGQVSSQTLSHLAAIDQYAQRALIRPLAGMLKEEIIDWARRIGTASISERAKEVCDLSEGPVAVHARWTRLAEAHEALPPEVVDEAMNSLEAVALDDWLPGLPFVRVLSQVPTDRPCVGVDEAPSTEGPIAVHGRGAARMASALAAQGRDVVIVLLAKKGPPEAPA